MEALGQRLDRDLTWVGAAHLNTGRLHVHLLVAGEGAQPSKAGARRVVRFTKSDLKGNRGAYRRRGGAAYQGGAPGA